MAGLALVVVLALVAEPVRVASGSMAPALLAGDHVVVDKLDLGRGLPERGEVVVFREPGSGALAVKRVVAVGGEEVAIEHGRLVVDGVAVGEPYADLRGAGTAWFGPLRLPAGTLFVLGDARRDSIDSRHYGPVPAQALVGRVAFRLWPPWR